MRTVRFGILWSIAGLLLLPAIATAQFSFSTNFDGTAHGGSISVSTFTYHGMSRPAAPPPVNRPSAGPTPAEQKFLVDLYQRQLQEAQRRAEEERARRQEEERLRREAEAAKAREDVVAIQAILERLQRLLDDEPNTARRAELTRKLLDEQQQFERARAAYRNLVPTYERKLSFALSHIVVPPPPHPLHYKRILVWGARQSPESAKRAAAGGAVDPFTGEPFDDVFAFGTEQLGDVGRALLDHVLGPFEQLSAQTRAQIGALKGAEADEIVCHSNGCRVVQVLIATGMLKAHKVRLLGADNVAFELETWRALKGLKGLSEVSIFMMRRDPVPLAAPGWRIVDLASQIRQPVRSLASLAQDATYQMMGVVPHSGFSPSADVHVQTLDPPPQVGGGAFDTHPYLVYEKVLSAWRKVGCLPEVGPVMQKCMIY